MTKPQIDKKRHLLKAITWRIVASISGFFIAWGVTGDVRAGLSIGAIDVVIKLVLYYLHERTWYKSKYGITRDE